MRLSVLSIRQLGNRNAQMIRTEMGIKHRSFQMESLIILKINSMTVIYRLKAHSSTAKAVVFCLRPPTSAPASIILKNIAEVSIRIFWANLNGDSIHIKEIL